MLRDIFLIARIPLLSPQGCPSDQENIAKHPLLAAKRQRAASTEDGWFSDRTDKEHHPGCVNKDASRHFLDDAATPPRGDARREWCPPHEVSRGGEFLQSITDSTAFPNASNNPSCSGGPDNCTAIGRPLAPSACGKVIIGKSARVQGPFITGSPVVAIPSGAVPGAAGVISASNFSNSFAISRWYFRRNRRARR